WSSSAIRFSILARLSNLEAQTSADPPGWLTSLALYPALMYARPWENFWPCFATPLTMAWQKRSHLTFLSAGIVKQLSFQAQVAAHGRDFCRWLFSVCTLALDAVIHDRRRDSGHPQGPLALGADVPIVGSRVKDGLNESFFAHHAAASE